MQFVIEYDWWTHYPKFFGTSEDKVDFAPLLKELEPLCNKYNIKIYGKSYEARRISTTFKSEGRVEHSYYDYFPSRPWSDSPSVSAMKEKIEAYLGEEFDYCLAHVYRDGNDKIDWHADKEASGSVVASVSFGASRKFRFRRMGETKGWEKELVLGHGDLLVMEIGCQKRYKHCVPCQKRVKEPRINLTFRQYE